MSSSGIPGFVGRARELARLDALFTQGAQLVSIVGGPGVGKSRLATAWAKGVAPTLLGWRSSIHVDLSATSTREELAVAIAHGLGLRDSVLGRADSVDLGERIDAALETEDIELVILDDADRAIDAAGALLARWIELVPRVRFLVTSRQALRMSSEHLIELAPFDVSTQDDAAMIAGDAGQLIALRCPDLVIDRESAPWIARIVRALDGNPLAIELAAARLRSLGVRDVVEHLERGIDLLDRGARDASERHGSLRRAIDASWETASEDERALLRRCSVFRGPFDLDAAIEVAELESALDVLHGVRERSLLGMQSAGGRSQYALSGPVGAFAREKLEEAGERESARARHARWLARRAEEASERWRSSASDEDLAFLREHQGDFADAREVAEGAVAARLVLAFDVLLAQRERPEDHAAILARPLEGELDPALRSRLRVSLALAYGRAGDARRGLAELGIARADDPTAELEVVTAELHQASGALDDAEKALQRALERAPDEGATSIRARRGLGLVAHARGRIDRAEQAYREALEMSASFPLLEARLCCDLGSIRLQQHRLDEARELLLRALERSGSAHDPVTVGLTEGNLGILAQEEGRLDDAALHFERALAELARSGHRLYEAHLTLYLGFLEHERGQIDRAVQCYERALGALGRAGDRRMAGVALAGLGAAEAQRDRIERAREVLDDAERQLEGIGDAGLTLALELHRAHLILVSGEPADRDRVMVLAREASPELLGRSDDARTALRILRARLGAESVSIAQDGAFVRMPDGTDVDLARRDVLKRIIVILATARIERPGVVVPIEALIDEAWPGERMKYDSALNRLKVALSTLRKLGMKDLIQRKDDGYLLDPSVTVAWI